MYKYLANTVFTGKNIIYLPTCHSTNDYARQLIQDNNSSEGIIVITDNQTAGRGQRGNTWSTIPGDNLTFSVIYTPLFLNIEDTYWLNIIVSLSIQNALKNYGFELKIKWPNDILAGQKKLGGILIENIFEGRRIKNSIIGIGLNVNQSEFDITSATSLYRISNRFYNLQNLLESTMGALEKYYLQLRNGRFNELKSEYMKHLFGLNELQRFEVDGEIVSGTITGVDTSGRLKVEITGKIRYFSFKEIKFLLE